MILEQAIMYLVRVHTEDDELTGFRVKMGAAPSHIDHISAQDYVKAWETLRDHISLRTRRDGSR